MRRAVASVIAVCAVVLAAGCYETPQPVCAFLCGSGGDCPDGYTCANDGFCKRNDVNPAMVCPGVTIEIDASDVDAPPIDADIPDAEIPDAEIPDAEIPDAPP